MEGWKCLSKEGVALWTEGGVKGRTGPNGESDKTYGNLLPHNQNKTKTNSARILSRSHEKRKGKGAKS